VLTAPTVTAATTVTVTATSVQDSVVGNTAINIIPSAPPPGVEIIPVQLVSVKCAAVTIDSGATDQCTATVTPHTVAQTECGPLRLEP